MIHKTAEILEMNMQELVDSASTLVAGDKGLLRWKGREHDNQ